MEDTMIQPIYSLQFGGWVLFKYGTNEVLVKKATWNCSHMRFVDRVEGPALFDQLSNISEFMEPSYGQDLELHVETGELKWVPMDEVSFELY